MMGIWKVVQKVWNVWKVENDNNNNDNNEMPMTIDGKRETKFLTECSLQFLIGI